MYLLEVYVARSMPDEARHSGGRVRAAAEELTRERVPVRYVRTTYLPDEETCFHLVEADSPEAVAEAGRRAGLRAARVIGAIDASLPPEAGGP